jgi:hypothetical protein
MTHPAPPVVRLVDAVQHKQLAADGHSSVAVDEVHLPPARGVAAQVEIESKIVAKMKAVYHVIVSSASFKALSM